MTDNYCKKIAIYGGSFDPIHIGHIALADAAVKEAGLDKLIFMPAYVSPFKKDKRTTGGKERSGMIEAALSYNEAFCMSAYELQKGGEASYTFDTLSYFEKITDARLYFVLGFDSVVTLDKWYKGEEILRKYPLITGRRNDTDNSEGTLIIEGFRKKYDADITILDMAPVDAASSDIRELVRRGKSVNGLVIPEVEQYIHMHGLYKQGSKRHNKYCAEPDALEKFMASNLNAKRYRHSLGVEKMAVRLADIYGADSEKAAFAGRYHDIAKCFDSKTMDSYIGKYSLDENLIGNIALAHSKVGAAMLEHEFGVSDKDILNAVKFHTTAREGMSLLEQVTYVSDVVEDNRTYPDLNYYQDLAVRDINQCTLEILDYTISDLKEKQRCIDKDTLNAYEEIKHKVTQQQLKTNEQE